MTVRRWGSRRDDECGDRCVHDAMAVRDAVRRGCDADAIRTSYCY